MKNVFILSFLSTSSLKREIYSNGNLKLKILSMQNKFQSEFLSFLTLFPTESIFFHYFCNQIKNIDMQKNRFRLVGVVLSLLFFLSLPLYAQYDAYIEKYKNIAMREMNDYGIPASITLAQGILESGVGKSELAVKANNHFGIKCHNDWDVIKSH